MRIEKGTPSPLPWTHRAGVEGNTLVIVCEGHVVATITERNLPNADIIVQAVNSHAELLEALRGITNAYREVMLSEFETFKNKTPHNTLEYRNAKSAIGHAEGMENRE